jgi:hypothetical protein
MYGRVSHNNCKYFSDSAGRFGIMCREICNQQVSDILISRVNVTKKSRKSNEVILFLLFTFIYLQNIADSIEKEISSVISNGLKPLKKERYSLLKGFLVLNEIQKLSRFYEPTYGNTETYSPETFCVKSFMP